MKKSIYEVYVLMQDQEQCDRMKQLCIDNGLPYWESWMGFDFLEGCLFTQSDEDNDFWVMISDENIEKYQELKTQITEQEFIELLKTTKL